MRYFLKQNTRSNLKNALLPERKYKKQVKNALFSKTKYKKRVKKCNLLKIITMQTETFKIFFHKNCCFFVFSRRNFCSEFLQLWYIQYFHLYNQWLIHLFRFRLLLLLFITVAGTRKDPWCLGIPVASPTETSGVTPLPVPKGKDLAHAFGLNHSYVYGEVASENLAFAPNCWTIAKYMGGYGCIWFPT